MASDSEKPKVMKHLSESVKSSDLDDTSTLVRIANSLPDVGDGLSDRSDTGDEEASTSVDDALDEADQTLTLMVGRDTPSEESSSMEGSDDARGHGLSHADDSTVVDEEDTSAGEVAAEDDIAGSSDTFDAPQDLNPEDAEDQPSETIRHRPSHAAPKSDDAPVEDEERAIVRQTPSHAALKSDEAPADETPVDEATSPTESAAEEATSEQRTDEAIGTPTQLEGDSDAPARDERRNAARSIPKSGRSSKAPYDAAYAKASGTADPPVYGLEESEAERAMRLKRASTQHKIRVGIAVAAVAAIGWLAAARPVSLMLKRSEGPRTEPVVARSADTEEQPEEATDETVVPEPEPETEAEPEVEEVPYALADQPTVEDILEHVRGHLAFDGNNVSVTVGDAAVDVSGGRVQVSHLTTDVTNVDPTIIAGRAAMRAAALCNDLSGRQIQGANGSVTSFTDVVWVVRTPTGDSYLAVTFPADTAPSSGDGLTVLAASPRYRLSDSMYAALGGTVRQEVGETPAGADGKYIWSTGVLPSSN